MCVDAVPSATSVSSTTTRETTSPRLPSVSATVSLRPLTSSCCSFAALKLTMTISKPSDALHAERSPARSDGLEPPAATAAAAAAARSAALNAPPGPPSTAPGPPMPLGTDAGFVSAALDGAAPPALAASPAASAGAASSTCSLSASATARSPLEDAASTARLSPPVERSVRSSRACGPSVRCLRSKAPARTEWRGASSSFETTNGFEEESKSSSDGSASSGSAPCSERSSHTYVRNRESAYAGADSLWSSARRSEPLKLKGCSVRRSPAAAAATLAVVRPAVAFAMVAVAPPDASAALPLCGAPC